MEGQPPKTQKLIEPLWWVALWKSNTLWFGLLFCFIICYFLLLWATPAAYGSSQARGRIRATAAWLSHSKGSTDPSCVYDLHHSSQQHWILKPPSNPRDRSCISWIVLWCLSDGKQWEIPWVLIFRKVFYLPQECRAQPETQAKNK